MSVQNFYMGQSTTTSSDHLNDQPIGFKLGPQQIGWVNFAFLILTVLSQAATILITWDIWQVRGGNVTVANLPWFGTPPQFDFGWLLLASLALTLFSPKYFGFAFHAILLLLAIATDQLRCQPQIISVTVLMAACVFPSARRLGVWFLIAMWFWAGFHKLLSPDWYGEVTYYLLFRHEFEWGDIRLWDYHVLFAVGTAVAELALGVLAWRRPKVAAPICFLAHVSLALFLILIDWNSSVLPWNFCTAIVGAWLLWTVSQSTTVVSLPQSFTGKLVVAIMLISPVGFYFGLVRHSLCHVLYSSNLPDAVITQTSGPRVCETMTALRVPFPHDPKAFLDLFRQIGKPGEKLHIHEYRLGMQSQYFEMKQQGTIVEISKSEFFDNAEGAVAGIAFDDRRKLFQLDSEFHTANLGLEDDDPSVAKILKRSEGKMIWAIKFTPSKDHQQSFDLIKGLPNLEQIQLSGSNITDEQLSCVSGLLRLNGIGLDDTAITDEGLKHLEGLPLLDTIQADRTQITNEAIERIIGQ